MDSKPLPLRYRCSAVTNYKLSFFRLTFHNNKSCLYNKDDFLFAVWNLFVKEVNGSANSLREILTKNAFLDLTEPFSGHCLAKINQNGSKCYLDVGHNAAFGFWFWISFIQLARACVLHWPVWLNRAHSHLLPRHKKNVKVVYDCYNLWRHNRCEQ